MLTPVFENRINKVRIVGDIDDVLAFKLRMQSLLSSADVSIPGIPPSSIVCIRSVPDPRPQTLRLVRGELEGAGAWSAALNRSLAGTVSRAARPTSGFVPSNADCVLFADKAEMLACVARDWLSGALWTRWWWKILLPSGDSAEVIKQLWRDHPHHVPAAIDQLQRQNKAVSFVEALTDDDCRELLQQTVRAFVIPQLNTVCQGSLPIDQANLSETSIKHLSPPVRPRSVAQKTCSAPWEPWCPESSTSVLSPERQRFLGIVLTIARAPSPARSREFARAVERWQDEITNPSENLPTNLRLAEPAYDEPQVAAPAAFQSDDYAAESTPGRSKQPPGPDAPENEGPQLTREFKSRQSVERRRARPGVSKSTDAHPEPSLQIASLNDESAEPAVEARREYASEIPDALAESSVTERLVQQPATFDAVSESPWVEIETQLGGLFYLINLVLYLNLYADFTMPAAPEIELNIWDFVALVGAELIGDENAEDPIWGWLAEMSGAEEGQPDGEGSEIRDQKRLPPEWLSTLMPDLQARLRTALGSQTDDDAATTLCRHYARVRATDTHVDVFFALDELPLEIRFAGLDRDPGWVPAAGRFIAFHFD